MQLNRSLGKPQKNPDEEKAEMKVSKLLNWAESGLDIIHEVETIEREVEGLENVASLLVDGKIHGDLKKLKNLSHNFINNRKKAEEKTVSVNQRRKGRINRFELLEVLSILNFGIVKDRVFEQMEHYFFMDDRIGIYNRWITIVLPFKIGVRASVRSFEFYKVIKDMKDEWIDIQLEAEKLTIRGLASSSHFEYLTEAPIGLDWTKAPELFGIIENMGLIQKNSKNPPGEK